MATRKIKRVARADAVVRKPKGTFHHPDLREALVRAAVELLERDGHAGFSLRGLGDRVGVSQPALYRHFENKESLFVEVARRGLVRFDQALYDALASEPDDPFAAIEAAGRAYVRFSHAHPGWFRLCFSRFGTEELRLHSAAAPSRGHERMFMEIGRIVHPEAGAVFDVFRSLWAEVHGLSVFVVERVFQLVQTDEERILAADAAIRVYVDALRARWTRGAQVRGGRERPRAGRPSPRPAPPPGDRPRPARGRS